MLLHKHFRSQDKKTCSHPSDSPSQPAEALPCPDNRRVQMISGGGFAASEPGEEALKPEQGKPSSEDVAAADEVLMLMEQAFALLDEEGANEQCLAGMVLKIVAASGDLGSQRFLRTLWRLASGEVADNMILEGDAEESFWDAH